MECKFYIPYFPAKSPAAVPVPTIFTKFIGLKASSVWVTVGLELITGYGGIDLYLLGAAKNFSTSPSVSFVGCCWPLIVLSMRRRVLGPTVDRIRIILLFRFAIRVSTHVVAFEQHR